MTCPRCQFEEGHSQECVKYEVKQSDLPKVIRSGTFKIGNRVLKCHVLDNGQRVFEKESLEDIFSGDFTVDEAIKALTEFKKL